MSYDDISENPVGRIELSDLDLDDAQGGTRTLGYACAVTTFVCTKFPACTSNTYYGTCGVLSVGCC